jgi:plasmid stabilization system protein ParE
MNSPLDVEWTNRSLSNAQNIRDYLTSEFSSKEVHHFEDLLRHFEDTVSIFPKIYPTSTKYPSLRRAVLHKLTSVFYTIRDDKIIVIAIQDNRQNAPGG